MGVGAHFVTSMVVERYLRVEKAKIKPKKNIRAKQKSSRPNSPKKAKKVPKCQTKNFKAKSDQKVPNLSYLALRNAKWQPWPRLYRCHSLIGMTTARLYIHQSTNPHISILFNPCHQLHSANPQTHLTTSHITGHWMGQACLSLSFVC